MELCEAIFSTFLANLDKEDTCLFYACQVLPTVLTDFLRSKRHASVVVAIGNHNDVMTLTLRNLAQEDELQCVMSLIVVDHTHSSR